MSVLWKRAGWRDVESNQDLLITSYTDRAIPLDRASAGRSGGPRVRDRTRGRNEPRRVLVFRPDRAAHVRSTRGRAGRFTGTVRAGAHAGGASEPAHAARI